MRIEDTVFSNRTKVTLLRGRVRDTETLYSMTQQELYKIRNLGRTGVEEIEKARIIYFKNENGEKEMINNTNTKTEQNSKVSLDVVYCTECGAPADKSANFCMKCGSKLEKHEAKLTIREYFNIRGYEYTENTDEAESMPGISNLASMMVTEYQTTGKFQQTLKRAMSKKEKAVSYTCNAAEEQAVKRLANELAKYCMITNLYISNNTIRFNISTAPRIVSFINGHYLEIYAMQAAELVAAKVAEKYGTDYEIAGNVVLMKDGQAEHELDQVIRIGDTMYWMEEKTGKTFDPDKSFKIGKKLGFIPDKLLMVLLTKTPEEASIIEYGYQCHVSVGPDLLSKLCLMLEAGVKKD